MPEADNLRGTQLAAGGWVRLKEPKNLPTAILLSLPLMALNTLVVLAIASPFTTISLGLSDSTMTFSIDFIYIIGLVLMVIAHEMAHAAAIPGFIKSDKTYWGLTYFGGFVYTEEVLMKPAYAAISLMPFIVFSIILPVALGLAGLLSPVLVFMAWLNAAGSSVDMLNLILVMRQVPAGGRITWNGPDTYWKSNSP